MLANFMQMPGVQCIQNKQQYECCFQEGKKKRFNKLQIPITLYTLKRLQ